MKKRKQVLPKNVMAWLNRGFGQGVGNSYIPFFHVRDVPSRGRSSIFFCPKTGRVHHYLSDLEYKAHILAEFSPKVNDIREQFALLPWLEPAEIADGLDIHYPTYPASDTPIVMTSDNVLTLCTNYGPKYVVISIKPSSELDPNNKKSQRTLEKLLIEKTYWEKRNIHWELITEQDMSENRYYNLVNLRAGHVAWELNWLDAYLTDFTTHWGHCWDPLRSLNSILDLIASKLKLTRYHCYMLFARAVWRHRLTVDLDSRIIRHEDSVRLLPSPADQKNIDIKATGVEASVVKNLLGPTRRYDYC